MINLFITELNSLVLINLTDICDIFADQKELLLNSLHSLTWLTRPWVTHFFTDVTSQHRHANKRHVPISFDMGPNGADTYQHVSTQSLGRLSYWEHAKEIALEGSLLDNENFYHHSSFIHLSTHSFIYSFACSIISKKGLRTPH